MSRTFFPTYSLNRFGVRVTGQQATLGDVQRFPAEPTPRAAMTPTRPILGAIAPIYPTSEMIRVGPFTNGGTIPPMPGPMPIWGGQPPRAIGPIFYNPNPAPIASSGGGGATPAAGGGTSSVSTQTLPTPTVATPPPAQIVPVLISSGGGTTAPSTPTVTAAAPSTTTGLVDGIAAWLSGTTTIFNYNIPNAVLAGVVVLGFALLSSNKKR